MLSKTLFFLPSFGLVAVSVATIIESSCLLILQAGVHLKVEPGGTLWASESCHFNGACTVGTLLLWWGGIGFGVATHLIHFDIGKQHRRDVSGSGGYCYLLLISVSVTYA